MPVGQGQCNGPFHEKKSTHTHTYTNTHTRIYIYMLHVFWGGAGGYPYMYF